MKTLLDYDQIYQGDCVDILNGLPAASVDVIFADPPYNLQLHQPLYRPNMSKVDAVDDAWDQFESLEAYDRFTHTWLTACRRVLKENGTIWVIGSYHNIYRVGALLQTLDYWVLNEIVWAKTNPMPNMRGTRFTNAHETLIWAQKNRGARYTFHYQAMKAGNEDLQMRSVWELPICTGGERLLRDGEKAHATQKPEALLWRVLTSSTNPGDVVLDPFFGTGTTGAVAKKLGRHYIGIERETDYIEVARERLAAINPESLPPTTYFPNQRERAARIPFVTLVEIGWLRPGQELHFDQSAVCATITADGALLYQGSRFSIHKLGTQLSGGAPCNGWEHWYYFDDTLARWSTIDTLRQRYRAEYAAPSSR